MMRQSWLISALIMGGAVTFAIETLAQVIPVPFEGTVPGACDFTILQNGQLRYELLTTGSKFNSDGPEGKFAEVELQCSNPASLSVEFPQQIAGPPTGTPVSQEAFAEGLGVFVSALEGDSKPISGSGILNVGIFMEYSEPLVAGDYLYQVNLILAPQ